MINHENFWRPPYEGIAAVTWLIGAAICFGIGRFQDNAIGFIGILSLPMLVIALYRFRQVLRNWHFKAKLNSVKPAGMAIQTVLKKRAKVGATWIGKGFSWEPIHARRANNIAALDDPDMIKPPRFYMWLMRELALASKRPAKGYQYVHGIGDAEEDIFATDDDLSGHTYIAGTTGAGKTRTFEVLISQAISRGGPVLVFDPKGDPGLLHRCYAETCRRGDPSDFLYCSPTYARNSVRINPLRNYTRLTQIADRIASLLPSSGNAQSFKSFSWRAVNVVIEGLELANLPINLANLRRYIEGDIDGLIVRSVEAYFRTVSHLESLKAWESRVTEKEGSLSNRSGASETAIRAAALAEHYTNACLPDNGHPTIDSMLSILAHNREHYSKLIQNLLPILQQLTSGEMAGLLSPDYADPTDRRPIVSLSQVVNKNQVIYVNFETLADSVVGSAFGSLLLADLTSVAADRYSEYDESAPSVSVFVDEAAELINEPFVQNLNKGRGAGFQLYIASQTIADFVAKMGDQSMAMQVLGNTNTTVSLRVEDPETLQFISSKFGETRQVQVEQSMMNTTYNPAEDMDYGSSHSKRLSQTDIQLVSEDILMKLPDLHFFASLPGGRKYKGRVPVFPLSESEKFVRPEY